MHDVKLLEATQQGVVRAPPIPQGQSPCEEALAGTWRTTGKRLDTSAAAMVSSVAEGVEEAGEEPIHK